MATRIGTMPSAGMGASTVAPLAGVPHFATKVAKPPRQNMLNVRVSPLKRLGAQVKPVKPDMPDNVGNF
jgi:hypothetical protein